MKITLKFASKNDTKQIDLTYDQSIIVGRSRSCDVQLDDSRMSSRHCRIHLKGDVLEIIDLDSKNGIYINGIRVENSQLFVGDKLKIGKTLATLEESDCDAEALGAFAFPGRTDTRMGYVMKADFTGARELNQARDSGLAVQGMGVSQAHQKEINIRRQIQSNIKLSKHEIKALHKIAAYLALLIDIFLFLLIFPMAILLVSALAPEKLTAEQQTLVIYGFQATLVTIYIFANIKGSKFTMGERLTGIEKMYQNQ